MYQNVFPSSLANFIFLVVFYVFIALEVWINLRNRQGTESRDKASSKYMFLMLFLAMLSMNLVLKHGIGLIPSRYHGLTWAGFVVMLAGILFRWYSIKVLGKFFTGKVMLHRDHELIQTGPYRVLRHPSYTGGMLAFWGIGLATNDWIVYLIFFCLPALIYSYRIYVEERALMEHFGEEYRAYVEKTWRILPYVY